MLKEARYFLLAVGFFTRIPVPSFADFQEAELNHSAKYFPLVGVLVGVFGAFTFYLAHQFFSQNIAVLISMASTVYLTGAFHEDGLADSVDGLGGGFEREKILTIMQDSRLGTYGAVALFFMLMAKFQVLSSLPVEIVMVALVAGHALSRLCAVYVMASLPYNKPSGKAKPLATAMSIPSLMLATCFGVLPLALFGSQFDYFNNNWLYWGLSWLVPVVLVWFWWRYKIKKWLGGYTGDCLGAMQQLTELAFYLGLLCNFS